MNKVITATVGIVVTLFLIGGGVFFLNSRHINSYTVMQKTISPSPQKITTEKRSLHDLMLLTDNQKCIFSDTQVDSSGTVYARSGNIRGDFQVQASGKSLLTHVVSNGKYVYAWMEGETKGYKMSLDVLTKMSDSAQVQYKSQTVDIKKQVNYSCTPWTIDNSKFAIPTTITFTDYTSIMQGAVGGINAYPSITIVQRNQHACSQCNQLQSSLQAQCRAALHC